MKNIRFYVYVNYYFKLVYLKFLVFLVFIIMDFVNLFILKDNGDEMYD